MRLYEQLAGEFLSQIQTGIVKPGDRLPSVRRLSRQKALSMTTVRQAYQTLEDRGFIEARPQSGYYVRWRPQKEQLTQVDRPQETQLEPRRVQLQDLPRRIRDDASSEKLIQFGAAVPAPDLIPSGRLNNLLARIIRSGRIPPNLLGTARG